MRGIVVINELERWFLRRRGASMAPKANLALVSDDPGVLRKFGRKITEYLNQVDDPENGGWFLFDDDLMAQLSSGRGCGALTGEDFADEPGIDEDIEYLFSNGGAVLVCSAMCRRPDAECEDVRVFLTGFEDGEDDPPGEPGEVGERGMFALDGYHAAVNAARLPGAMVVCLVGDAVLELSYRKS